MRYTVRRNDIEVIGRIWMPPIVAAYVYHPSSYDVENMREDDGTITRESVDRWLGTHAGDFQSGEDFHASIEDGNATIDIPWASEDSELTFGDCMCPVED